MSKRNRMDNNGNDSLFGDGGPNYINAGNGDDTVQAGFGHDVVLGGNGNDSLIGGSIGTMFSQPDDDFIAGGNGNDTMRGGWGDDTLIGGNGDDVLSGQGDRNLLIGGHGSDVFQFGFTAPRLPIPAIGQDTIADFGNGNDIVDLRAMNRDLFGSQDLAYTFIGQDAEFSGERPELRFRWEGGNTLVELNTEFFSIPMDTVVDGTITLLGIHSLTERHFDL
jgi:Ca2+-binding RTX toxin-like protein